MDDNIVQSSSLELWDEEWFGVDAHIIQYVVMHAPLVDFCPFKSIKSVGNSSTPGLSERQRVLFSDQSMSLIIKEPHGVSLDSVLTADDFNKWSEKLGKKFPSLMTVSNKAKWLGFPAFIDSKGFCCIRMGNVGFWAIHASKLWMSVPKANRRGLSDVQKSENTFKNMWAVTLAIVKHYGDNVVYVESLDVLFSILDLWLKSKYETFVFSLRHYVQRKEVIDKIKTFTSTKLSDNGDICELFSKLLENLINNEEVPLDVTWFLSRFDVWRKIDIFIEVRNKITMDQNQKRLLFSQLHARLCDYASM